MIERVNVSRFKQPKGVSPDSHPMANCACAAEYGLSGTGNRRESANGISWRIESLTE